MKKQAPFNNLFRIQEQKTLLRNSSNNNYEIKDDQINVKSYTLDVPLEVLKKQSKFTTKQIENCISALFLEAIPLKVIYSSLFLVWLNFESRLQDLNTSEFNQNITPLNDAMDKMLKSLILMLDNKPDLTLLNLQNYSNKNTENKKWIQNHPLNHDLPLNKSIHFNDMINDQMNKLIKRLLNKKIPSEMISNILFANWLRFSNILGIFSDTYFRKTEFYAEEILNTAQQFICSLCSHREP